MDIRMTISRLRLPLRHHFKAAGCLLCVAGLAAWSGATASGQGPVVAPAAVLVSVSTLDMSRLEPAHFGDWDVAAQPAR
jgi:hypothetical protein